MPEAIATSARQFVEYEDFGAVGDGVADDLAAICAAHEHANAHGLAVRSRPGVTYHLGREARTAIIATDTDWNTSRFTIDDTEVDDFQRPLFEVCSLLPPEDLPIARLARDQRQLDIRPPCDCWVLVENDRRRRFIRRGLNQNDGTPQHDCFILRRDGRIDSPIDWDYEVVTRVDARPLDPQPLTIRGGIFTTIANRTAQEVGYDAWARNIVVERSNTVVEALTHYVVSETDVGQPYGGFLHVRFCAEVTLRDCFLSGHKIYQTIGAAGKPVSMGSYDIRVDNTVNFRMVGCRMHHIDDRSRWGVAASNFCKNITLEDCTLSRMDAHMGVSGEYTIRRCTLGWMGLNAIGRGRLTLEDSTVLRDPLVNFRPDYGSTWEGEVVIRNCRWIPNGGETCWPNMFGVKNDGTHDFGYPCFMPREITVDGLIIDDANHPDGYDGLYLFADPDPGRAAEHPFPYQPCRKVTLRGVKTASGFPPKLSPNPDLAGHTQIVIQD